jgi:hypothetical protein
VRKLAVEIATISARNDKQRSETTSKEAIRQAKKQ